MRPLCVTKRALNKESFHFLEKGMLTKHKIWWNKKHAVF